MMLRLIAMLFFFILLPAESIAETAKTTTPVDPLSAGSLLNMVFGLALVIIVIFLMAWIVRRMGGMQFSGQNKLKVLGGLSLSAREKIVLVQVENKRLVVGVAPGQVNTLHVLEGDYQPDESSDSNVPSAFKEKLLQALQKRS